MALQRPHKGMKTGWCRERATTRVAPTTGLPEPIFIAITMALQRPHKGMKTGWCRERATTRLLVNITKFLLPSSQRSTAPTTGLPEPIFIAITMALQRPHRGDENGLVPGTGNHKGCPYTGLPEPIFIAITMALQRPPGWCRERATTRVAPTTGLPEPIFIAMKGYSANCEKAFDRLTLTPRGPAARRGRLPPPQAPHTSLPAPPHEQG